MIIYVLLLAVLLLTYSNGANDNFKGTATLWGSGTLTFQQALLLGTIFTFAGSVCSYFFAETLIKNFSGKGLIPNDLIAMSPPSSVRSVARRSSSRTPSSRRRSQSALAPGNADPRSRGPSKSPPMIGTVRRVP